MASSTYHEPTNVRRKYACPGSNRYNRLRSRSCNQASMGIKKKLEMETTKGSSLWGRGMLMLTPFITLASILMWMISFLLGGGFFCFKFCTHPWGCTITPFPFSTYPSGREPTRQQEQERTCIRCRGHCNCWSCHSSSNNRCNSKDH